MRLLVVSALMVLALPAAGTTFYDDGTCVQSDGQVGYGNGTTPDDEGCITQAEYAELFSAENLKASGVVDDYTDNGDGTTTLHMAVGGQKTIPSDPLDQKVTAGPEPEPDAPTVRDIFERLEAAGLTIL